MKLYEDQKEANERTQLLPKKPRDKQRQNSDSDDVTDVIYPLLPQLCASLISCLNTLSSGITVSYTSPAIPELRLPSQPSGVEFGDDETALFAAMIGIGAVVGAPLGSLVADKMGRKYSLMFSGLPLVVGWFMIIMSGNFVVMVIGRFLTGLSTSMGYMLPPLYISEIASKDKRGAMGAFVSIAENLGSLMVFGLGIHMNYRQLALTSSVAAALLTVLMVFMPDSPRWLLQQGDRAGALDAIRWLVRDDDKALRECDQMEQDMSASQSTEFSFKALFTDSVVFKTLMLSLAVQIPLQYSGMDVLMNYGEAIFLDVGFKDNAGKAVLCVAIFGLFASLATIYLMEKWGRVPLLMLSGLIMAATYGTFGYCLYLMRSRVDGEIDATMFWTVAVCLITYRSGYLLGWGAVGLFIPAELIPNRARGVGCGIAEAFSWMLSASVSYTFLYLKSALHDYGTFWLYAGINLAGIGFVYIFLPETKGISLEEFERQVEHAPPVYKRRNDALVTFLSPKGKKSSFY